MGIDLTLVIDRHGQAFNMRWFLGYDRLSVPRDYNLFDHIKELPLQPLPPTVKFDWYGDEGCKERKADPYGKPLTWVSAGDLAPVFQRWYKDTDWSQGAAIAGFLVGLPPSRPIVLWWC